jgi:hypothetical protein
VELNAPQAIRNGSNDKAGDTGKFLCVLGELCASRSECWNSLCAASLAARLRSAVWFPSGMEDLRRELEDLVNAEPFVPFVVTSNDGFAIAVGSAKRALVGLRSSESWILRKGRGERKEGLLTANRAELAHIYLI